MPTADVVGAGLAGAACAQALAQAGYCVTVHDASSMLGAGASGVPVAIFAPSVSKDDAPHSRMLRQGANLLVSELERLTALDALARGQDWAMTGVLERCLRGPKHLPTHWQEPIDPGRLQSRVRQIVPQEAAQSDGAVTPTLELWHPKAGWVLPQRLIAAWLEHPSITLQLSHEISATTQLSGDVVIVATGHQTPSLLPTLKSKLQPIRGQVEWGDSGLTDATAYPINGMGHMVVTPSAWLVGATFQRDETSLSTREKDRVLNFEKFNRLMPNCPAATLQAMGAGSQSWVGIRAAQANRALLIEQPMPQTHPNWWVCTGLGSRGLTLAALAAQQLLERIKNKS